MSGTLVLMTVLAASGVAADAAPYQPGRALNAAIDRQLRVDDVRQLHRGWYLPAAPSATQGKPQAKPRFSLEAGD